MVCDAEKHVDKVQVKKVLILILLEYGLRRQDWWPIGSATGVLILILLEYSLRQI